MLFSFSSQLARLARQDFWLHKLGFVLPVVPPKFSPLRLAAVLSAKAVGKGWDRGLLTTNVEVVRASNVRTPLVVNLSGDESLDFWTKDLVSQLKVVSLLIFHCAVFDFV